MHKTHQPRPSSGPPGLVAGGNHAAVAVRRLGAGVLPLPFRLLCIRLPLLPLLLPTASAAACLLQVWPSVILSNI